MLLTKLVARSLKVQVLKLSNGLYSVRYGFDGGKEVCIASVSEKKVASLISRQVSLLGRKGVTDRESIDRVCRDKMRVGKKCPIEGCGAVISPSAESCQHHKKAVKDLEEKELFVVDRC